MTRRGRRPTEPLTSAPPDAATPEDAPAAGGVAPPAPFSRHGQRVEVPSQVTHLTRGALRRAVREREEMLSDLQRQSFGYFLHEVSEENGLVLDKTAADWPASIAAIGMALTAYPVGVARGLLPRSRALARTLTTLRFLAACPQGGEPDASGHRGFFYHFLDMKTGRRAMRCELSTIDTALLVAGALAAAAFFDGHAAPEAEVRRLANLLYERVEWDWMLGPKGTICHGWKPESGRLRWHWAGYDEALILYVLALGSPTHPVPESAYEAWCSTYAWRTVEGLDYLHAGPLFIHQMSHLWIDFRDIRDAPMRAHDSDYFLNSRLATRAQQRYAMRNPRGHAMYGEFCWGITASDGPGAARWRPGSRARFYDYIARGIPDGPDDGTLAPWAVVASLPFAPGIVLPAIAYYRHVQLHTANPYGFKASFNASYPHDRRHPVGWVSPFHFGINEGPTVLMIENHRTGMVWSLMRRCPAIVRGLRRAGFTGGWLERAA